MRVERQSCAFSLLEIMVVVGLLAVIVLGLMAMFTQTQRAFRLGMTQTDVLEGGRMATDLIVRELEQITPSYLPQGHVNSTNFCVSMARYFVSEPPPAYTPLQQPLPGSSAPRVNVLDDVFFITHENQTWSGIGYFVRTNGAYLAGWGPVGALYRVQTNLTDALFIENPPDDSEHRQQRWKVSLLHNYFANNFTDTPGNVSKILDGVVHFRVRAFDTNGYLIVPPAGWTPTYYFYRTNYLNIAAYPHLYVPGEVSLYAFRSNAVPAYLELELGILEPAAYDRYKSIPVPDVQLQFLENQAGRVHLFRQRVAIRNVDRSAYQ